MRTPLSGGSRRAGERRYNHPMRLKDPEENPHGRGHQRQRDLDMRGILDVEPQERAAIAQEAIDRGRVYLTRRPIGQVGDGTQL